MELEDEADVPVPECHETAVRERRQVRIVDPDAAAHPASRARRGRASNVLFPTPDAPDDGDHLSLFHREIETAEDGESEAPRPGSVFVETADLDEPHVGLLVP